MNNHAMVLAQLRDLGVRAGDVVMVHASLKKLGCAAAGVIAALDAAVDVDGDGVWLMVLGDDDAFAWVNERAEAERAALLTDAPVFDHVAARAQLDVGLLAELMRQAPGTVCSDHPEGRFGARGRRAGAFVDDVPFCDYYGPGSPLQRFADASGKVLRLGADDNTITLLHYAEYLCDVPNKRRARRHRKVRDASGAAVVRVVDCLDDTDGIVDVDVVCGGVDYFGSIFHAYVAARRIAQRPVGGAASELLDARDLLAFAVSWMNTHLQGPPR